MQKTSGDSLTQVVKGGGVTLLSSLGAQGIHLVFHVLVSRVLGPYVYGLYALGKSIVEITSNLSMLGFTTGIVHFAAIFDGDRDAAKLKGTILTALVLPLVVSLVLGLAFFTGSHWLATWFFRKPDLQLVIQGMACAVPFYTLLFIASHCARGLREVKSYNLLLNVIHPLTELIGVVGFFMMGFRLGGAVAGFVLSAFVAGGGGLYWLSHIFRIRDLYAIKAQYEIKRIFKYSISVLLIQAVRLFIHQTDRIMLGVLGSAHDVGIFVVAGLISQKAQLMLQTSNVIFPPIISNLYHQGHTTELEHTYKSVTQLVTILTLPIIIIYCLMGPEMMGIFGPEYVVGSRVLLILALSQFVNVLVGSVGFILVMTGRQNLELINSWCVVLLNIVLNYLLIPAYGIVGAAIATGISMSLLNIVRLVEVYYIHKFHPFKLEYIKIFVAGVLSFVALLVMKVYIVSNIVESIMAASCSTILYFLIIMLLGIGNEEKQIIDLVRGKLKQTSISFNNR